jgi:hypothetical protein
MLIIKASDSTRRSPGPSTSFRGRGYAPVKAAIEKEKARYIPLSCGHFTTREAVDSYAVWRPKGTWKTMCEVCGSWKPRKAKPRKTVSGDQIPLF